jgi:hypothetical protein
VPTTTNSDKAKTKIDRIKVLADGWTPWPHEFDRLQLKYKISHSFFVTLFYLWSATVGSSDDSEGTLAITQIPARRKHVLKWIAALCQSGSCFFLQHKAPLGSQEGSLFTYREHTTPEDWEKLFEVLAQIELLGGLEDCFSTKTFAQLVASNFNSANESAAHKGDYAQVDDDAKRKFLRKFGKKVSRSPSGKANNAPIKRMAAAAMETFEAATRRKRN